MTTISPGNKKITTRKIPATCNKVLVHTGSLHFFKKYWLFSIEKFWLVPVPVRETQGCSNHSNLEMEAECLTKTLPCLNLNISRTKNGRNKL